MGEQQTKGDEGFVENATSEEEVVSTPSTDGDTPTEAVVEPGAVGLTGDESEEEIQAHLESKYKEKGFSDNDREQVLRWRTGSNEAKVLKAELTQLKEATEASGAGGESLHRIADAISPDSARRFAESPEEWEKWVLGNANVEPEPVALDATDPMQRAVMELKTEVAAMRKDRADSTLKAQQTEAVQYLEQGIIGLDLQDDKDNTVKRMMLREAEFELATGGAKNGALPTKEEMAAALKKAQATMTTYNALISGATEQKIKDGTPKTPTIATEAEVTTAESVKSDDWLEAEKNQFAANATRRE